MNTNDQKQLFSLIDLKKVDEKTLEKCKDSPFIPQSIVTEAALSLCSRLRKELAEARLLNKSNYEYKSNSNSSNRPLIMSNSISSDNMPPSSTYTSAYTSKYRSPCKYIQSFLR